MIPKTSGDDENPFEGNVERKDAKEQLSSAIDKFNAKLEQLKQVPSGSNHLES